MNIIKVQFKKCGEYQGKAYSYATTLDNVEIGDLLMVRSPSGTSIVRVCETGVAEESVAEFKDRLCTISRGLPRVGDEIEIVELFGAEDNARYEGRTGKVTCIDDLMQIYGTWGDLAVIPEIDDYRVMRYGG